jgi:hypothetical protein
MNKKLLALFCLFLALPFCFATITDEPNSVSCQINEVEVSPDLGSAQPIRENITSIGLDKYWEVWCYVQDAQNNPVSSAVVTMEVDGTEVDYSNTTIGWVNFPVVRSSPPVVAFYSTATPGEGTHSIKFSSGTLKPFTTTFNVGATLQFDVTFWVLIAGFAVVAILLLLNLFKGKRR